MRRLQRTVVTLLTFLFGALVVSGCLNSMSGGTSGQSDLQLEVGKSTGSDVRDQMQKAGLKANGGMMAGTFESSWITVQTYMRSSDKTLAGIVIRATLPDKAPKIGLAGIHIGDTKAEVESVLGQSSETRGTSYTYRSSPGTVLSVVYSTGETVMIISYRLESEVNATPY